MPSFHKFAGEQKLCCSSRTAAMGFVPSGTAECVFALPVRVGGGQKRNAHMQAKNSRGSPQMQQIPQTEPAHRKQRVSKQFRGNLTQSQTDSQYERTHSPNVCTGPLVSKRTRRAPTVVNAPWLTQNFCIYKRCHPARHLDSPVPPLTPPPQRRLVNILLHSTCRCKKHSQLTHVITMIHPGKASVSERNFK